MLSNYVGEDRFLKGVSIYLKKRLYANSVSKDLWDGVSEATGLDIPKMMEDWVGKVSISASSKDAHQLMGCGCNRWASLCSP